MISLLAIEEVLNEFGITERHEVKYAIQFYVPCLKQYVYINKQAGTKASGFVIHPRFEFYTNELTSIDGVETTGVFNHKSSMRKFPKRLNRGLEPIPFGIPFGFFTKDAMRTFIKKLSRIKPCYLRMPEDEIKDAQNSGEFDALTQTEVEQVIKGRRGQGKYREGLVKLWGKCSVTGCKQFELLRASHKKPWRDSSNEERLDPHNGLLLTPNLDALFDSGMISFDANGGVLISKSLDLETVEALALGLNTKLSMMPVETAKYLKYHREFIFLCG
ncbi:HNH endonuclease [Neptuniibacter sp. PT34_22]|uniref:HNH endonuclease n=1 Tax=Neptuniibacter sp. PT34_22 TaxID=3398205 RepID=UPI0039F59D36